ncbi:hypothetical protein GPECTOR_7g1238 [Gonium pectorale]|uniref:Uncharacterized protein n=1 Tax=Gonium pectorale TaxID=33097 RepID=A0A150GUC1_GONPE|nr:hypothetical protein GPECTOR_7g1238 [Gonium pectorale]|eukprot:KXZ53343.1 hypothetical protein GPECTOR_7g1238 [Gonium pectorale]
MAAAEKGDAAARGYLVEGPVGRTVLMSWDQGDVFNAAVLSGSVEAAAALHEHGFYPGREGLANDVVKRGHLPMLKWLVATFGQLVARLCELAMEYAAGKGDAETLAWLHARGVCWGPRALPWEAAAGCEEALEFMLSHGCEVPECGQPYVDAAKNGGAYTIKVLKRLGVPWGPRGLVFGLVAREVERPLPIMRMLLEYGCPVDWALAQDAVLDRTQRDEKLEEWVEMRLKGKPGAVITLMAGDGSRAFASKALVRGASPIFAAMLPERREDGGEEDEDQIRCLTDLEQLSDLVSALEGEPPVRTYLDYCNMYGILEQYKPLLRICLPKERTTHQMANKWLSVCEKYGLDDLGWHMAERLAAALTAPGGTWAARLLQCKEEHPDVPDGFDMDVL